MKIILELIFDPEHGEEFLRNEYVVTPCHGVQTRLTMGPDREGCTGK
jgi:hypothetical protein